MSRLKQDFNESQYCRFVVIEKNEKRSFARFQNAPICSTPFAVVDNSLVLINHGTSLLDREGKLRAAFRISVEKLPTRIANIEAQGGTADESRKALKAWEQLRNG